MKQYKAILLDWDQTIGDWDGAALEALQEIYRKYRLAEWYESFDDFYHTYKVHNKELWTLYGEEKVTREYLQHERFLYPLLHALGLQTAPKAIDEMADRIGNDFLDFTNKYFHLLPGAKETVEELAKRYPLTIVSNGFSSVQHYKIDHSGLKECFQHIVLSEEVGVNKPQPGIFRKALELNGVTADEALLIGDSWEHDIVGARNVGIDTIWVIPDKLKVESIMLKEVDKSIKSTYEVTKLAEVLEIL